MPRNWAISSSNYWSTPLLWGILCQIGEYCVLYFRLVFVCMPIFSFKKDIFTIRKKGRWCFYIKEFLFPGSPAIYSLGLTLTENLNGSALNICMYVCVLFLVHGAERKMLRRRHLKLHPPRICATCWCFHQVQTVIWNYHHHLLLELSYEPACLFVGWSVCP